MPARSPGTRLPSALSRVPATFVANVIPMPVGPARKASLHEEHMRQIRYATAHGFAFVTPQERALLQINRNLNYEGRRVLTAVMRELIPSYRWVDGSTENTRGE